MNWPEHIIIVDDNAWAEEVKKLLLNLTWINNVELLFEPQGVFSESRYPKPEGTDMRRIHKDVNSVGEEIRGLAKSDPRRFDKDSTRFILIAQLQNVEEAIEALKAVQEFNSLAFIDFNYKDANSKAKNTLKKLHKGLPDEWQVKNQPNAEGGCVFSHAFQPEPGPPLRLLCQSSQQPPRLITELAMGAITEKCELQGGPPDFIHAVVVALNKWVELQDKVACPLTDFWYITRGWFEGGEAQRRTVPTESYMPHTIGANFSTQFPLDTIEDWLFKDWLNAFRDVVQRTLGVGLPEEWWLSPERVKAIHDSLKHMTGKSYCGDPYAGPKHNLTIGSVYFIALLAMRDVEGGDLDLLLSGVDMEQVAEGMCKEFLPLQRKEDAKRTARAIYFLLHQLFTCDRTVGSEPARLTDFHFDGQTLCFTFNWPATTAFGGRPHSLCEQVRDNLPTDANEKPVDVAMKAIMAINELNACMLWSGEGFGSPGAVWMRGEDDKENNTRGSRLYIAAAPGSGSV